MARPHVPKFGNWDGDNVPYTAYFENARKEKASGIRINPNDPEQNPEAFNVSHDGPARQKYVNQKNIFDQRKSASRKMVASESSSDKSPSKNSVTSILKPEHQRKKSNRSNKYSSDSRSTPSPGPNRMNHADDFSYKSVSVPKFGQWDEMDPRSAEGFTVIFNKVKEEKQIAAAKFPPVPLTPTNNYQTSQKKETKKRCCFQF